ncbi:MAG TPA: DsbA family protein [Candidatus Limnocylindrales bacterium]|nr:DsbA family protein [Candidatus Limnocylindrales bacterium]
MEEVKLYFDYKSPFAYLAKDPAFELANRFELAVRWIPFILRIKGKGERSIYSEYKARYSYLDARRWANRRGGFPIKGPLKIYDSVPSLIGGLFAMRHGFFRRYTDEVYSRFFDRRLEIDRPDDVAALIDELGQSGAGYREYLAGSGPAEFEACQQEAAGDHIFGVPIFVFRGEPFWGHDRMPLLEERLAEAGLLRPDAGANTASGAGLPGSGTSNGKGEA